MRVRNFETNHLKVNDADGNPVEIAAIVVWQVVDTAKSTYAVENYPNFVIGAGRVGAASRRHQPSLRRHHRRWARRCAVRPTSSLASWPARSRTGSPIAGVEIVEVRISHLAYAQEIAQAMLRRQQANAVVAARSRIVEGAVGMVELALNRLTEDGVVSLDEERTASMVSNLMVVLCGDQPPSPVVNTGLALLRERAPPGPAAGRPGRPRRADPLGERRVPQRQRAGGDGAAPGPDRRRPDAQAGRAAAQAGPAPGARLRRGLSRSSSRVDQDPPGNRPRA